MLGVTAKWVDNVVSEIQLPGVVRLRRGVERRIGDDGLLALALCLVLRDELGIPTVRAARLAGDVVSKPRESRDEYRTRRLSLRFKLADLEREIHERMRDAADAVAQVRRGRPPRLRRPAP
jgi:hypothetical protein